MTSRGLPWLPTAAASLAIAVILGAFLLLGRDPEPAPMPPTTSIDIELPILAAPSDDGVPRIRVAEGYRYDPADDLALFLKYTGDETGVAIASLRTGDVVASLAIGASHHALDARVRKPAGELVVLSRMLGRFDGSTLLLYDLSRPGRQDSLPLEASAAGYTIFRPLVHLSTDEQLLYYESRHNRPNCEGSGAHCTDYGVAIVDLETRTLRGEAPLADRCGVAHFVPEDAGGMLVTCQFGTAFHVLSDVAMTEAEVRATPTPSVATGQPTPQPREWRYIDTGTRSILVDRADGSRAWLNIRAPQDGWVLTAR